MLLCLKMLDQKFFVDKYNGLKLGGMMLSLRTGSLSKSQPFSHLPPGHLDLMERHDDRLKH